MTQSERRAFWAERVAAQGASGASAAAWCAQWDVPLAAFYQWRKRLAKPEPVGEARWARVDEGAPAPESGLTLRVGAAAITVTAGFDPALLAEVVRALEARC